MHHLLLFKSPTMQQLIGETEVLAASDASVLILGETGTGKNVLAEHIHRRSGRQNGSFLHLDCAVLSRNLLESELFGHEKGAFTGATEKKAGYLDMVCGGTLFLDEIENLDQDLQTTLLSVLDGKQFWRVGGREKVTTDFRLISASNVDIPRQIQSGKIREDFYYRIKGHTLTMPPLRERREDIQVFVEFFLQESGKRYQRNFGISREALTCLRNYHWPGNIRELRMVLESVVGSTPNHRINLEHLPLEIQQGALLTTAEREEWKAETLLNAYVKRILKRTGNNKTQAAKLLGWSLNTLKRHLQKMEHDE